MFRFTGFELDPQRAELRGRDGAAIRLRPKTFDILRLFVANAGRVLSKQELMEAVWPNVHVGEDNLFQCIREIRTALGDAERQIVKLVSGRGYVFAVEVSAGPTAIAVPAEAPPPEPVPAPPPDAPPMTPASQGQSGIRALIVLAIGLCLSVGLAAGVMIWPQPLFNPAPPMIAVMPITAADGETADTAMAEGVTQRLVDGFAGIQNIRLVAPQSHASGERGAPRSEPADYELRGELQRDPQAPHAWTLRARMIRPGTGEVQSAVSVSVDTSDSDASKQQIRLAAAAGHLMAQRLNRLLETTDSSRAIDAGTKAAIEQANASINQTSRERFGVAQTMLHNALAAEPDNIDIAVALAGLQLRGIQMVWYAPTEAKTTEQEAAATLERALRLHPDSIPVLEAQCRFLSATNHFADSLIACQHALSFDPWNGSALYLIGLGQIHLGRFEDALATFMQADRYDTPQVSRWTWLLGAGWANLLLDRCEEALPLITRSIAITPASGRSYMLVAACEQRLGRIDDAKAAMQKGLALRPGTTALTVRPPLQNVSPLMIEASEQNVRLMVAAGLPER